jgi:hypothetical protein
METSARAPDGRTGNCCSRAMLVFQENEGPWQMIHVCVSHIRLTAIRVICSIHT